MTKQQIVNFLDKMLSGKSEVSSKRVHALIGHVVLIVYLFTLAGSSFALAYLGYIAAIQGLAVVEKLKDFKDE